MKSAVVADPSTDSSVSSYRWTNTDATSTPTTAGEDLEHGGRNARRLCSVTSTTSTSTYVQPSQLPSGEGIYENSDADDLDDVSDSRRFQKKRQQGRSGSSKNVRRWKVTELLSTPPRLIRRIKNVDDGTTSDRQHGHRKLAASRSADELMGGSKSLGKANVAVERTRQRPPVSRFSYIYGSVSDDDADCAGDRSSKLGTLDQLIPVYEEFKSATARSVSTSSQRNSDHYVSIDDLDDQPDSKVHSCTKRL